MTGYHLDRRLSVAPMMDHTDRHFRYLLRLISRRTLLYTEMITSGALLHGPRVKLMAFSSDEQPLALQLGGSDPQELMVCASLVEDAGYQELNLNVGCPSNRVQAARFGACLMAEPDLVADCVEAMQSRIDIPVTVKTRVGIDDIDSYEYLCGFIENISKRGCNTFIIHARKAWLKGLSPKQNREVPPLQYPIVHRLKHDFPELDIIINGGISSLTEASQQLRLVDGVMIGRSVVQNPYLLAKADQMIFDESTPIPRREDILKAYVDYMATKLSSGVKLQAMARHLLGLYQGEPGARSFRRVISENAYRPGAGLEVIHQAARAVGVNGLSTLQTFKRQPLAV